MKKINLRGISEVLSEKELKNVMGGSGSFDCITSGAGYRQYTAPSFSVAYAWCDFWATAGYACRCYGN